MNRSRFWFLCALGMIAAISRVVPHPLNFAPMAAIALFGGATFEDRRWAMFVPIASLLLSDVLLQITYSLGMQPYWGFYAGQWVVYACVAMTVGLGMLLRHRRTAPNIAIATLCSSIIFFLATNFVYAYGPDSIYPRNLQGLIIAYNAAIPFFKNSLAGDFCYSSALFGLLALAESRFEWLRRPASSQAVSPT